MSKKQAFNFDKGSILESRFTGCGLVVKLTDAGIDGKFELVKKQAQNGIAHSQIEEEIIGFKDVFVLLDHRIDPVYRRIHLLLHSLKKNKTLFLESVDFAHCFKVVEY
jgi:hypothetical protein